MAMVVRVLFARQMTARGIHAYKGHHTTIYHTCAYVVNGVNTAAAGSIILMNTEDFLRLASPGRSFTSGCVTASFAAFSAAIWPVLCTSVESDSKACATQHHAGNCRSRGTKC